MPQEEENIISYPRPAHRDRGQVSDAKSRNLAQERHVRQRDTPSNKVYSITPSR